MKIGVAVPQSRDLHRDSLADFVRAARELSFASLWVGDHLVFPASLPRETYPYAGGMRSQANLFDDRSWTESVVTLAAASSGADGMELGFGALLPALRDPIVLAKQLATLDRLAGGSLIVGMGVGWLREEYAALTVPFEERIARVVESLEIMRTLWHGEPATHRGRFWSFEDIVLRPAPLQGPWLRCWYGGNSLQLLRKLAPSFSGWLPYEPDPEVVAAGSRIARESRAGSGVEGAFTIAAVTRLPLSADGDVERARSMIESYAAAGVEHLVVLSSMGRSVAENRARVERLRRCVG